MKKPGNYEVELGMTFRDLIFDIAGGIREDRKVKFFIPGGASSQWLTGSDEHLDAPIRRVGAKNVPVAYNPELEEAILPQSSDVLKAIRETARY